MSKKLGLKHSFQALNEISRNLKSSETNKIMAQIEDKKKATLSQSQLQITQCSEESVSKLNTVQNSQCETLTVSQFDPVAETIQDQNFTVSESDSVKSSQSKKMTESISDTVKEGEIFTGSKIHPVEKEEPQKKNRRKRKVILKAGTLRPGGNFTAVPNVLLRSSALFAAPAEMMIYLHLFSYSYGFGRNTCDMSQAQLEDLTGLTKNTVKRTLDSLQKGGWIKMLQEYECARTSRKWQIFTPFEKGCAEDDSFENPDSENTEKRGSEIHTVKNGQCQNLSQTVSNSDPLTGSKFDPYKETLQKNTKKSLSASLPENLKTYFSEIPARRKLEREWQAFSDLKKDFRLEEISNAFDHVQSFKEPPHSPMSYLAQAMGDVLLKIEKVKESQKNLELQKRMEAQRETEDLEKQRREEVEFQKAKEHFERTFPRREDQSRYFEAFSQQKPFLTHVPGAILTRLAIRNWAQKG